LANLTPLPLVDSVHAGHRMKRVLVLPFLLASTAFCQSYLELVKADPNNWSSYSGSFGARRHSALKQINTANVDGVMVKWLYDVPRAEELEGVPVVSMYQAVRVVTRDGKTMTGVLIYEPKNLVPIDFDKRLTPEEFHDLLALLSRQATR
jgi:hypothetical protein